MAETARPNAEIAPNDIIVEHLASLISSDAHNDNVGGAIAATYLAQQSQITRAKYNLAVTTSNLASYRDRADFYEGDASDELRQNRLLGLGAKIVNHLLPGVVRRTSADALLSLAVYKIEEGFTQSEEEAKYDFQQALDGTSRRYRPALKGRWLTGYYRSWLRKSEPTETELIGIAAARQLMKPRNPVNVVEHLLEGRRFNKKRRHLAKLTTDFDSFASKQTN